MDAGDVTKTNLNFIQNKQINLLATQDNENNFFSVSTTNPSQVSTNEKSDINSTSLSKNDVKKLIQKLNDSISSLNDSVKFSYSEDAKGLIVKVIDSKTGQVIRQIPPEELIKLEASLAQSIGIIFNKEVK
ncbi:flagellar protein FlaG [Desulfurella sp.]|uniref:flagellar protein FlaG n=1 Tax=Desulfurella sp. TaxID=1962857 RepID=UPI0025BF8F18|nr:flagellar protein FlaG [Desulfurella sp.]